MKTDPATKEIRYQCLPVIRVYKDGTVERLADSGYAPPGPDPSTRTTSRDVVIDPDVPVRARLYLPESANSPSSAKLPILLYFHGGGFCAESAFSRLYHPFLCSLSARARVLVVSLDYRLAPESPVPAAYDDCLRGLRWALAGSDGWISAHGDAARVFLAGDSAGGNIAHSVALRAGEAGLALEGVALLHPYFWGADRMGSELATGALLKPDEVDALWSFVCGGGAHRNDDPRVNPLVVGDEWTGRMKCRRMLVTGAGKDILRDRARAYCDRLRESEWDGTIEYFESEGEDHVFFLFNPQCQKALELMDMLVAFFKSGQECN
ncbi:tuliposide A-converting enzyme 1, chloroplastic-like [Iris pallida]|uniref:Tuliposide A-converting enzyme 1, chloroplastic-like n=1 Tax=Iris pallida TaxID=29817 RepID=A0AAX6F2F2_IRIPA|nr:tuliposide A-converting enzyme 1, chloroplastic-like [Iris pallida]